MAPLARRFRSPHHRSTSRVGPCAPRRATTNADRAADLIAEEDDLARTLAQTWARDPEVSFPRLHVDPDRLLAGSGSFWTMDSAPESPDTPIVESSGWGPVGGDIAGLTNRLRELIANGTRVVVAADGEGSANRIAESFLEQGLELARATASTDLSHPGGFVTVAPLHRGWHLPRAKVAVICESDLTGRRRAHRRPRQRTATTTFEGLRPGSYVVHEHHGVGRYRGWSPALSVGLSATTCCSPTRAPTSCTCPRIRSVRSAPTSVGDADPASTRGQ